MVRKLLNYYTVHTLGKICGHTETSSDTMDMFLHSVTVDFCHIFVFSDNKKCTGAKILQETGLLAVQECFLQSQLFLSQAIQLCKLIFKLSFIVMAKLSLLFPKLLLLLEG